MKCGAYEIHTELKTLDADSERTGRGGYIETWQSGNDTCYSIKGDLPRYVCNVLARIAESKGYLYWFNGGSYFDVIIPPVLR